MRETVEEAHRLRPPGGGRRRAPDAAVAPRRAAPPRRAMTPGAVLGFQRLAGNAATASLVAPAVGAVQREVEDTGRTGEDELAEAGGPAVQPGAAEKSEDGVPQASGTNEFGEMDGEVETGVVTHAFASAGKTGTDLWHHAGGTTGGTGYSPGAPTLVAPVYESAPPAQAGEQATAWIRKGTGTANVKTFFTGVPQGNNGAAKWDGSGTLVYLAGSAVSRMDVHEVGHSTESKRIHDVHIKPLEARVGSHRAGFAGGAPPATMKAASEAEAIAALKAHVDWNASITAFSTDDLAANRPMGTWDTTDQAKANFYHDKGPKRIAGVDYGHNIEAP